MGKILSINKYSTRKLDLGDILNNDICQLNTLFNHNGFNLLIAGGAVRDIILNEKPNDFDFVTDAKPDEILRKLKYISNFRIVDFAKDYGCISFEKDKKKYEVTSLREDVKTFGRAANVRFTDDLYKDAKRRDFFCNSMYLSFNGTLYDPLNAYQDTLDRRITFIGDVSDRIQEDHLRILRYLRFLSKLNTTKIRTAELEVCYTEKALLLRISKEKIKEEIIKLISSIQSPELISRFSLKGFLDLFDLKVNDFKHAPKLALIKEEFDDLFQNPLFEFTLALDNSISVDSILRTLHKLRFTNNEIKHIKIFLELINSRKTSFADTIDMYIYKYGREFTRYAAVIFWLFGVKNTQKKDLIKLLNIVGKKTIPIFPVESKDILDLGVKPGKVMGEMIKRLEKEWLSSNCQLSKIELLAILNI